MAQGPILIVILLAAIAFIIWATSKVKLHPFLALLIAAYGVGITAGLPLKDIAKIVSEGFGGILTNIGIVIIAGTIIGTFLEKSGAAITMADSILRLVGPKRPALAMSIIGYIVSIPVFCDSGYVILSALNRTLARRAGVPLAVTSIALATGLYATHTLVPPTPGPIAAAGNLGLTNLGLVILIGVIFAIPAAVVGYWWANRAGHTITADESLIPGDTEMAKRASMSWEELRKSYGELPGTLASFAPIVVPILLIALGSIANFPSKPLGAGVVATYAAFLGTPVTALLLGVFCSFFLAKKIDEEVLSRWVGIAIKDAAIILVITAAGGSLGKILSTTPIGGYLGKTLAQYNVGILLPFIIAAALKTAQGSSTVALVTTSALLAPMLPELGFTTDLAKTLVVMAIGAGAMTVSHANDSYFWVVSQFSGMNVRDAYRGQTMATLLQGITTIIIVWLAALVIL